MTKMNFKDMRKKAGLSQMAVAQKAGISLPAYQLIERGVTKNPRTETVDKIRKVLNHG